MDPALGPQVPVRTATVHCDRDALDADLLALGQVEDLGCEPMALCPPQVHAQQHLGPVGGFGPPGAGTDGQEGVAVVVLAAEQEGRAVGRIQRIERGVVGIHGRGQLGIVVGGGQLRQLEEIRRASLEVAPDAQLLAQALGVTQQLLRGTRVVPEVGCGALLVELRQAALLVGEVKASPRWPARAPRGRGWPPGPSATRSQVLQQDRPELDHAQRALATGYDGVHAGTIPVVRADAAITVTVKAGSVAALAAVALTRNQIEETLFCDLRPHDTLAAAIHRCRTPSGGTSRVANGTPERGLRRFNGVYERAAVYSRGCEVISAHFFHITARSSGTGRGRQARGASPRRARTGPGPPGWSTWASRTRRLPGPMRPAARGACGSGRSRRGPR